MHSYTASKVAHILPTPKHSVPGTARGWGPLLTYTNYTNADSAFHANGRNMVIGSPTSQCCEGVIKLNWLEEAIAAISYLL
jgi:hypothetical protein